MPRIIKAVFQLAITRDPEPEELEIAQDLLRRHAEKHGSAGRAADAERLALIDLCRAIFNVNEFLYID